MSDEAVAKGIGGALLGGGAVAGAVALKFGAVFAPAIPFIVAGGAAGGGLWGASASKQEKAIKDKILKECMIDRGCGNNHKSLLKSITYKDLVIN